MDSRVKSTAWSLGLYTLFAAGKTLFNMPWHKNAPTVSNTFEAPKAPVLERKVSVVKTAAQVGGGALLVGAAAALEEGLGGGALSSIASLAHSAASVVWENLALRPQLLAGLVIGGYLMKRYMEAKVSPAIQNHIHINVNGGDVKPVIQVGQKAPKIPLTEKQIALRKLFQKLVFKKLEIEKSKVAAREAMEVLHYRRLLKELEN